MGRFRSGGWELEPLSSHPSLQLGRWLLAEEANRTSIFGSELASWLSGGPTKELRKSTGVHVMGGPILCVEAPPLFHRWVWLSSCDPILLLLTSPANHLVIYRAALSNPTFTQWVELSTTRIDAVLRLMWVVV